jgi:hypothetical protein
MLSKYGVRIKLNRYRNVYCGTSEFILAVYLTLSMLLASYKYDDVEQIDITAAKSPKKSARIKYLDNRT